MRRERRLPAAAAVAAFLLLAGPSLAQDRADEPGDPQGAADSATDEDSRDFDVEFGSTFTTDYIDSGLTETDRGPAVQPFAEATYKDLYAGIWGSNVDPDDPAEEDAEIELSAGIRPAFGDLELDLGFVYKVYPGEREDTDYLEIAASGEVEVSDALTLGLGVEHAPDASQSGFAETEIEASLEVDLPRDITLFSTLGVELFEDPESIDYPYGEVGFSVDLPRDFELSGTFGTAPSSDADSLDYVYWDAGIAYEFKETVTLDLRYHDTDLSARECEIVTEHRDWCGTAFVASLKFETSLSGLREASR